MTYEPPVVPAVAARPVASAIAVHALVLALRHARWSENNVPLSMLTVWPITVMVLAVESIAST